MTFAAWFYLHLPCPRYLHVFAVFSLLCSLWILGKSNPLFPQYLPYLSLFGNFHVQCSIPTDLSMLLQILCPSSTKARSCVPRCVLPCPSILPSFPASIHSCIPWLHFCPSFKGAEARNNQIEIGESNSLICESKEPYGPYVWTTSHITSSPCPPVIHPSSINSLPYALEYMLVYEISFPLSTAAQMSSFHLTRISMLCQSICFWLACIVISFLHPFIQLLGHCISPSLIWSHSIYPLVFLLACLNYANLPLSHGCLTPVLICHLCHFRSRCIVHVSLLLFSLFNIPSYSYPSFRIFFIPCLFTVFFESFINFLLTAFTCT